jgi:ribosomal protein L34
MSKKNKVKGIKNKMVKENGRELIDKRRMNVSKKRTNEVKCETN